MENDTPQGRSYWDHLGAAQRALELGDFPVAEREFECGLAARDRSPGRVFFTEKISDSLDRLIRGRKPGAPAGRWGKKVGRFRTDFLALAESTVRQAVRLAELRPEDDAETNQPVLEKALFLVGRSRLFSEEPSSAVPLLKGLFRTAGRTGLPFDVQLIRHDIPLSEEDRLWLARKGPAVLEEFVAQGQLQPGSPDSENWVQIILQLLHPRYFGSTGRLEEERAWLEAVTTDRLLCRSQEAVDRYRDYLKVNSEPGPRADEARVRLLEILGNTCASDFPVPRYAEALGVMQSAGLATGSAFRERFQLALEQIEYRRPDPESGCASVAWASLGLEPDGRVAAVFWWHDEPRDVAFWSVGEDVEPLAAFLAPCLGRIVARNQTVIDAVAQTWPEGPATWSVRDFTGALLEPVLPAEGLSEKVMLQVGLGESGPWRDGWKSDLGNRLLEPPRRSALLETWQGGAASGALLGGLVWLAVLSRLTHADPSLRAGIGAMARRGDPASKCIYQYLNFDKGLGQTLDASFEPWTLPLLWTRPDPLGWSGASEGGGTGPDVDGGARPDLGHNDLAIVTTGDPAAVLGTWGQPQQRWRVVLDRLDRLPGLARIAAGAIGPVTLIPAGGRVHGLKACLALLEEMLTPGERPQGSTRGLLPLFHWVRLVETHNGDLLDFLQVRPRPGQDLPLYQAYQELVSETPLVAPALDADDGSAPDPWAQQFAQRVRKAGLVAGLADSLESQADQLDALWGVFEGSEASWVFLDSAAVHWYLLGREGASIQETHALLHSRGHRHLSVLTGALWMRSDLEELLGTWLQVYGRPYCLALTNLAPPVLRLADRGVVPHARHLRIEAHAAQVAQVTETIEVSGGGTVLIPRAGTHADLWRRIAGGEIPLGKKNWQYLHPGQSDDTALPGQTAVPAAGTLIVPILESLAGDTMPLAEDDTSEAWARADQDRNDSLQWRRRLCGLEFASLLAGVWESVEVLDCRWWRILAPAGVLPEGPGPTTWNGEKALAAAEADGCRLFNLPGLGAGKGRTIHPNITEAVRHWLATQALAPAPGKSAGPRLPEGEASLLTDLAGEDLGRELIPDIARAWEKGQLDRWMLLVGDEVPAQAAAEVAASYFPGISVWRHGAPGGPVEAGGRRPGPVLWCRAKDLTDPALVRLLQVAPSSVTVAMGIQEWLPGGDNANQDGALALRTLAENTQGRLILQAQGLSPAWVDYLRERLEVERHQVSAAEESGASSGGGMSAGDEPVNDPVSDAGRAHSAEGVVRRLRRLLDSLPGSLQAADFPHEDASHALVPGRQLAWLAGLPADQIQGSVRLLRWLARLAGDSLSNAEAMPRAGISGRGHTLLIKLRFAEVEHQLAALEDQIALVLPLLLGNHRPGLPVWFDLEDPPVEQTSAQWVRLDSFLALAADSRVSRSGLVYTCPRGSLNSTRRLIATERPLAEVITALRTHLEVFRNRLADIMGSAVETGAGFLVETGLDRLRPDEDEFLALGAALGLWTWSGPATAGGWHLVDLLSAAGSPTVQKDRAAWSLLERELAASLPDRPVLSAGPMTGRPRGRSPGEGSRTGNLKNLLFRGNKSGNRDKMVTQVRDLAHPDGSPGLLVISGASGTGRLDLLTGGLSQVWQKARELPEATVYAPDTAAAVHFLSSWARQGLPGPVPAIHVAGGGRSWLRPARAAETGEQGRDQLVIMLEMHRFEPETRYQIAQAGRGRRLFMTTDPAAATEPWEHLFLTIPRSDQVIHLQTQQVVSRRIWSEIQALLPERLGTRGDSRAEGKGWVETVYAVNLDQCLARLVQEVEAGQLGPRLRLVGPVAADLDFLGASLRGRGWFAVSEDDLEGWLLPGARELLASLLEAMSDLGLLKRHLGANQDEGPDSAPAGDANVSGPEDRTREILPCYLGPEADLLLPAWREARPLMAPDSTVADFFASWEEQPCMRSVLAEPLAGARARQLAADLAGISLGDLAEHQLFGAWWLTAHYLLGQEAEGPRRPLVLLNAADRPAGAPEATGAYLCLGSELPRRHYTVLSKLTHRVLILYKEKSPLAGEQEH